MIRLHTTSRYEYAMTPFRRFLRPALLLLLAAALASPLAAQKKAVQLTDVFSGLDGMGQRSAPFKWLRDGTSYAIQRRDSGAMTSSLYRVDARTGTELGKLADLTGLKRPGKNTPFVFRSYELTPDERFILFTLSQKPIWRRSTLGEYAVFDIAARRLIPLPEHEGGVRNPHISPDGRMVGYVWKDDIYVMDLASGQETRLTGDAQPAVYNGRFGWVYEEEFSIVDGWMWSPDGARIAFWQEDERKVPEYTLTDWTPLHLELTPIRYPKPGDTNPFEKIGVIDIATKQRRWIDLGSDSDLYIPRMQWADNTTLFIHRLGRLQNHLELLAADAATGATRLVLEERSPNGWLDVENCSLLRFLKTKKQFLWTSERDGWQHVYRYAFDGTLLNQVTKGPWEVTQVAGLTADESTLYYVSTEQTPLERHLYSISLDGSTKRRIDEEPGYHTFSVSPACALYTDSWSTTEQPSRTVLFDGSGDEIRTISETKPSVFDKYAWSDKELFSFTTKDGLELHGSMIKPPDFDPAKRYPVFFDVYGGPGGQNVRNSWPQTMHEWLANEGFIVVEVDNRGGGYRGTDFKFRVYKQLGRWEVNDYVECARYLATLPYVNAGRIGIWGWSYGGYMAALAMLLGEGHFAAGVAVAPPTDWRFYDTIYAERFMQRPADNPDGYKVGSCVENAEKLTGKLLLIHGGQDDNVHLQNQMQLVDRLEQAGLQFEMRVYPNGNHGVATSMKSMIGMYEYFITFMKRHLQGS
jgi:dipeptidyl-peptidase-4